MLVKRIKNQSQGTDEPQIPWPMVKAKLLEPQFWLGAKHRPSESDWYRCCHVSVVVDFGRATFLDKRVHDECKQRDEWGT